jgi:hypothetical protein
VAPPFPEGPLNSYITRCRRASVHEASFGYRSVEIVDPDGLPAAQEGYNDPGWQPTWLVIATDDLLADPIFIDLTEEHLPVYTAVHGIGRWEPVQIADSFEGFVGGLEAVASIARRDLLPDAERSRVLSRVRDLDPRSDAQFWEEWLTIED